MMIKKSVVKRLIYYIMQEVGPFLSLAKLFFVSLPSILPEISCKFTTVHTPLL